VAQTGLDEREQGRVGQLLGGNVLLLDQLAGNAYLGDAERSSVIGDFKAKKAMILLTVPIFLG